MSAVPSDPSYPQPVSSRSTSIFCISVYLAAVLVLLLTILNHGHFTYTLDDPYIHLALADSIAHGHYGINPGEPSSPSSSILWPFLLVPFARFAWNLYTPLVLNILFCCLSAWLLGRAASRIPSRVLRFPIAIALMLVANLAGLTFVGMEHGLQVLLAIACALGVAEALADRPIPPWCLAAAILGPAVRYENFALTVAVAIALYGQRRLRTAVTVTILSLIAPVAFSLFLISCGLPALPSSVLVKSRVYKLHGGPIQNAFETVIRSIRFNSTSHAWHGELAICLLLLCLTVREAHPPRRLALAGATLAALLQLAIGQFNWFYRYEIYAVIFGVLIAMAAITIPASQRKARPQPILNFVLMAALFLLATRYTLPISKTPAGAADVYQQQYQMHRFVAEFYRQNVAVNDLGLVSYSRPPGVYILDLWGLASPAASRQYDKNAAWLDATTRAHRTGLAILYPDWYIEGAPDDWTPLATMCIAARRVSIAEPCVAFYATAYRDPNTTLAAMQQQLATFARTLPPGVKMTLGKDTSDADNLIDRP